MEKKFQFFRKLLLLTLLMLGVGSAFGAWDGTIATTAPGDTTIDGKVFYKITNEQELAWFAAQVNSGKKSYNAKLMANLDMGGKLWTPIGAGNNKNNYNGTFDGDKHVISNLYIAAEELIEKYNDNDMAQNIGFIGCFSGTVKNLIIENIEVHGYGKGGLGKTSGNAVIDKPISIGTVVGWQSGTSSVIDGCYATGVVITSGDGQAVGGIVGNVGGGTVSNCYSTVDIYASGLAFVGGIAGYTKNYNGPVTMESCIYAGNTLSTEGSATVNGQDVSGAAGAIIGYQYKGTVTLSDLYYDEEQFPGENAGIGATTTEGSTTGSTTPQSDVNSAKTICLLNKGDYNESDGSCSKNSPWEMGESGPALIEYSSDGYKITFHANEGSFAGNATSAVKYVKLDYVINDDGLVKPSRDDFAFIGWSKNMNATVPDQNLGTASGAATFYAVWNPVYTITFSAAPGTFPNEASGVVKTVKVEKGKKIAVHGFDVPEPYHDNEGKKHSFMGWAEKENPTEEDALIDENGLDNLPVATKNTTLYAVWVEATVFTVIFDANGHGTTVSRYQKTVYDQDVVVPLTEESIPHEDGFVLNSAHGWCVKPECGENDFFDFSTPISENITLYANWDAVEYDVSYENLNGASNSNPAKYTAAGLTLENLVSVDGAQEFKGWCVDEELKNCITSIPAGTTGDVTLYAKWEDVTYPIIYRAAGSGATGNVSQGVKYHGVPYTLLGESYDRPGYKQNGWTTSLDGEKIYDFGDTYTGNASVTFYPTWEIAHYTITYVCEGCTDVNNPTTYTKFDNADLKFVAPTYPKDQYQWVAWYRDAAFTKQIQILKKGSYGDTTIYGKLLKFYNITYELNGKNVNANNTPKYHVESTVELKAPNPASIDGYTFAGWYDNAEFTGEPVTEIPLGSTGDRKFYARWAPITYTITYVIDGEENAIEAGSFTVEGAVTLPTPTKDQYTFDGWYETEALTGDKVTGFDAGTYKTDKTFYAKWDKVYPFVTQYAAVTVTENADGTKTATVNDGYTAAGTVDIQTPIDVDNIVINRTFSAGTPGTIMLPFTLPSGTTFNNAKFYYLQKVEQITNKKAWKATMKWIGEGNLPEANKPYGVICQNTTLEINLNGEKATLQTSLSGAGVNVEETGNWYSDETGNWRFVGVYAYKHWTENEDEVKDGLAYALAGSAGNGLKAGDFGRVTKDNEIYPMRSYMRKKDVSVQLQPVAQTARAWGASYGLNNIGSEIIEVEFVDDEKTTAIGHLNTVTGEIKIDRWFDLKGRSVKNVNRAAKGAYYGKKGFHE